MTNEELQFHQQLTLEHMAAEMALSRLGILGSNDPAVERQQREQIQHKVRRIALALDKLNQGSGYGVCQQCGCAIHTERLQLLPYAELCVDCQRQTERQAFSGRRLHPAGTTTSAL
jgi:RNA polymerase-binding transcription factor DksA